MVRMNPHSAYHCPNVYLRLMKQPPGNGQQLARTHSAQAFVTPVIPPVIARTSFYHNIKLMLLVPMRGHLRPAPNRHRKAGFINGGTVLNSSRSFIQQEHREIGGPGGKARDYLHTSIIDEHSHWLAVKICRVEFALWQGFALSALALAAPLLLAALGELTGQKSGVLNIGLEGMMLCGAWAGAAASFLAHNAGVGLLAAAGTGMAVAALFATLVLVFKAEPVVVGTGLNLFALGLTGTLNRAFAGRYPGYTSQTLPEWFFVGLGFVLVPLLWWVFYKTRLGLKLRAAGDAPHAAEASGTNVLMVQWAATLFNGCLCGLAGAFLTLSAVNSFGENVSAGRGFIALAIVIFGRWSPIGALGAALLFGAADAAQITLQGSISTAYYPLLLALPYLLTLLTMAGFAGKSYAPAALGKHL